MNRAERTRQMSVYASYILFFTLFQVTFSRQLSFQGQVPDLMFVLVVLTGYLYGSSDGMVIGLIVGLLRDYFSGSSLGVGMLILLYTGVLASSLFRLRFHQRISLALLQVSILTFIYKFLGHCFFFIVQLFTSRGNSLYLSQSSIWFHSILPQVGLNLLAAVPMLLLMHYLGPYGQKALRKRDGGADISRDAKATKRKEESWLAG